MPKEIGEQLQKPKVLLLLGHGTSRLVSHLPALEQEIMHKDPNRKVLNARLAKIKLEDISTEPCDVISIYAHGNSGVMQIKAGQKKHKVASHSLIDDQNSTVKNLLNLQSKKHNRHFDILGCYQGAVIQDIERNVEQFEEGTTFTIHAPAQYSTSSDSGNPILLDQLKQYAAGETNQAKLFGRYTKQSAETLFFIKVVKDADGKNTLIAFKAIAPKYAEDARSLEKFMKQEAIYQFGSKTHQHANLVTLMGADHPEYQSLHDVIVAERSAIPLSDDYLQQTLSLHKRRDLVRKMSVENGEPYRKKNTNKEPLAETLLQQYQDIPGMIAKSYDSISLVKEEYRNEQLPRYYSSIIDYAITHKQTIGGKHPLIWAMEENIKINGKNPLIWAIETDKKMGDESTLAWAIKVGQKIEDKSVLEFTIKEIEYNREIVEYAIVHNQTINGKHPLIWVIEENIKINGENPILWAIEQDKMIGSEPVLEWAVRTGQQMGDRTVLEFAMKQNKKIGNKSAIEWALEHDLKIAEQPVLEWAIYNEIKIGELSALEYAVLHNVEISGQPALAWLVDHHRTRMFSEDVTSSSHVLEYIKDGNLYTKQIPASYSIAAMVAEPWQEADTLEGATIDGVDFIEWTENYRKLFTQHNIFGISPVEYAIEQGKKIKGFDTISMLQIYNVEAIEAAVESGNANELKIALAIDPNVRREELGCTPLTYAIRRKNLQTLRTLFAWGGIPTLEDASEAVQTGDVMIVRTLLENPSLAELNDAERTELLCQANNAEVVEILLQHKADPNRRGQDDNTPLGQAVRNRNLPIVRALLNGGAKPDDPDKNGVIGLHKAIALGENSVVEALLAAGANPNEAGRFLPDGKIGTDLIEFIDLPVCLAAKHSNAKIISLLADRAADLNQYGANGKTSLSTALELINDSGKTKKEREAAFDVVKTLLARGANPNALNKDGSLPLSILRLTGYDDEHDKAIKSSTLDLLIAANASLDLSGKNGVTLLQSAVMDSNVMLVEKLLVGKANPNIQDEAGRSALSIALSMYKNNANYNITRIIALLIQHGATPNVQDNAGVSPLQISASFDNPDLMNRLLEARADPNTQDKEGNSSLSCLVERAIKEVDKDNYRFTIEIDRLKAFLDNSSTDPNLLNKIGGSQIESVLDSEFKSKSVHFDSFEDNKQQLVKTLIEAPRFNANLLNKTGVRLLNVAIDKGDYELVALLLKKADVNLPDLDGTTPLHHAIKRNSASLVELLLKSGANPMGPSKGGVLPIAAARTQLSSNKTQYSSGERYNNEDIIEMLQKNTLSPYQKVKQAAEDEEAATLSKQFRNAEQSTGQLEELSSLDSSKRSSAKPNKPSST